MNPKDFCVLYEENLHFTQIDFYLSKRVNFKYSAVINRAYFPSIGYVTLLELTEKLLAFIENSLVVRNLDPDFRSDFKYVDSSNIA